MNLIFAQNPVQSYQDLILNARSLGFSDTEILQIAASQGYTDEQLILLQKQLAGDIDLVQETINERERLPVTVEQSEPSSGHSEKFSVFGLDLFAKGSKLSFTPDVNLPTPKNYKLGPGDELYVDIYGTSEKYYTAIISPDGFLTLSNIGPINLNGLTVDQAKQRITTRLSKVYSDLTGSNPTTFLQVSLGNARSINVHIVGEVNVPGTYTLSGFSTAFNALYAASGPTDNGTLREIEVFRSGKLIAKVDLYEFLTLGKADFNVRLESEDVIRVKPYINRVLVKGEVKSPGYYEVIEGETAKKAIQYAGGFTSNAYKVQLKLERIISGEKAVSDIEEGQYEIFTLSDGDILAIGGVLDRYRNRVNVDGAIYRPGSYALTDGMTLRDLVDLASGVRGDAVTDRVLIIRTGDDYKTESLSVNLSTILNGNSEDFLLKREDQVKVLSIHDIVEQPFVKISGEVVEGGSFRYSEGMSLDELIFMAKGIKNAAKNGTVEISRIAVDQNPLNQREITVFNVDGDFLSNENIANTVLNPFDHVIVRRNPDYFNESTVTIVGEILYPGSYAITSREERVSDLIKRSGGLTRWAHRPGANLIRRTEFYEESNELARKIADLYAVKSNLDTVNSEADKVINANIDKEITNYIGALEFSNENIAASAKRERLSEIKKRNPLLGDIDIKHSESIALDLETILNDPGSAEDIVLEEGDIIIIPKELETVRLRGQVLYPNTVQYDSKRSALYYINKAGGFDTRAKRGYTYVVHANGEVDRTKRFLFFKTYPKVTSGAEVIVPVKPPKIPLRPSEIVSITTGLAALITVINQFGK